jgi:uncharacterized membrane protein
MILGLTLHLLAVIIWVGGMFFAHFALRPAVNQLLEPPLRLPLLLQVFTRFFRWVWLAIVLLWLSGGWLIYAYGGFAAVGIYVHVMLALATVMTVFFSYIFFVPFQALKQALAADNIQAAAFAVARIRVIIFINLILGLLTSIIAKIGVYF